MVSSRLSRLLQALGEPEASSKIDDAKKEIQEKSRRQIEEETAYKWAARAVAAYQKYRETKELKWLRDSEDYYHESIEHSALADHSGDILKEVREWVHGHGIPRQQDD